MAQSERRYLPAAGHNWFLPLYDPLTKLIGAEKAGRALLDQAELRPSYRVLDVGCGTGTLALLVKRLHPQVEVIGLDPDPRALARARRKAERAGVSIRFEQGFSDALDHPDGTFDRVFSSMMFHHLPRDERAPTLREIRRVLKPGGRLEMMDFAEPEGSAPGLIARLLHSHSQLKENTDSRILAMIAGAGFGEARIAGHRDTLFGRVSYYQASRPA
ncbi:MAG TPA: class I SAM-dependent methyltransferase [Vicinamibacterales bacterium]|nr:class I SAM-dependent methyltransferase [Vicinamibacterales bacterium]